MDSKLIRDPKELQKWLEAMDLKKTTKNHFGSFPSDQIAFCPIL